MRMDSSTPPAKPLPPATLKRSGFTTTKLARAIFDADYPEQFIKELPVQALYRVLSHNGLESSHDLLMIVPIEKCRVLLDFDCWSAERFSSSAYWNWIRVTDSAADLEYLQKFLKFADLKLVAILIAQYVEVITNDEPSEVPPEKDFSTPDKGWTWLSTHTDDPDLDFQLRRLLAMIFETDAKLFYDLLTISQNTTIAELEELAFQDRNRRLAAEGIPSREFAVEVNSPLGIAEVQNQLKGGQARALISDIQVIEPLIYDEGILQPLGGVLAQASPREEFEAELTVIINCAIVHFNVDHSDELAIHLIGSKVKGAINLGLQLITEHSSIPLSEAHAKLGLRPIYQLGLSTLLGVRKKARSLKKGGSVTDSIALTLVDHLDRSFPEVPAFFNDDGSIDQVSGELVGGSKPFEHLEQLRSVELILSRL